MNPVIELASFEREKGDLPSAFKILTDHLRLDPDDARAWVQLAAFRLDAGDPDRAEKSLQKAFSLQPDLPEAWIEKGRRAWLNQDDRTAESALGQAIALGASFGDAYTLRGLARRRLKKFDVAREDFRQALLINPKDETAAWQMRMFQEQDQARQTGNWVTIAVHFDPDWLFMMKNMLLEQGIPTRISKQDAVLNLDASTDYNRMLQVRLEESEQAFWALYNWQMQDESHMEPDWPDLDEPTEYQGSFFRQQIIIPLVLGVAITLIFLWMYFGN